MKRLFLLLFISIWGCLTSINAQLNSEQYLLDNFQEGTVYYRDGRKFNVMLNYNVISQEFLFLNEDNITNTFAEIDLVTLVKIGDRTFLHDKKKIQEVLQIEPPILVQYRGVIKDTGKDAGYGGKSTTSAIQSYSGIYSDGQFHKFEGASEVLAISRVAKRYQIQENRKKKNFNGEATFLKIYPMHKEKLKSFIKENRIDFNVTTDVVKLCNYAFSLR